MKGSIYGPYYPQLEAILDDMIHRLQRANHDVKEKTGFKLYEHVSGRVKSEESMVDKCRRKGLPVTTQSALKEIRDAIGIRIVCGFVNDIYQTVDFIKAMPGISVYNEKDFVYQAKPNGYRSYHLILEVETEEADCLGECPGHYYVEVQLRTIAMDSWAALEHQLKYKHDIQNPERIAKELKRCADELASCDLSMQTIRQLIQESGGESQ